MCIIPQLLFRVFFDFWGGGGAVARVGYGLNGLLFPCNIFQELTDRISDLRFSGQLPKDPVDWWISVWIRQRYPIGKIRFTLSTSWLLLSLLSLTEKLTSLLRVCAVWGLYFPPQPPTATAPWSTLGTILPWAIITTQPGSMDFGLGLGATNPCGMPG